MGKTVVFIDKIAVHIEGKVMSVHTKSVLTVPIDKIAVTCIRPIDKTAVLIGKTAMFIE